MKLLTKILFLASTSALGTIALSKPFGLDAVSKSSSFLQPNYTSKLVFSGVKSDLRADSLKELDRGNLYVIPIDHSKLEKSELEPFGKVLIYKENDFAVVESKENEQAFAEFAHHHSTACGALTLLSEHSEIEALSTTAGAPVNPVDEKIDFVSQLQEEISHKNIEKSILFMEAIGTRFHTSETGISFPSVLAQKYRDLIPQGRTDVSVNLVDIKRSPQDNLVVRITGSEFPEEVIILGSHIDSITSRGGSKVAPGGDDDASGTAINLEIFRVMMEKGVVPKRTLEIHGYGAEEVGLVGSGELASNYSKEKIDVKAMVQFDLALYSGRRASLETMYFVSNGTNSDLNSALMSLAEGYLGVKTVSGRLNGGTSDHQSWMQKGFAAAIPTENPSDYNRKIHTTADTLSSMPENAPEFAALYSKLGLAYVAHFGGF